MPAGEVGDGTIEAQRPKHVRLPYAPELTEVVVDSPIRLDRHRIDDQWSRPHRLMCAVAQRPQGRRRELIECHRHLAFGHEFLAGAIGPSDMSRIQVRHNARNSGARAGTSVGVFRSIPHSLNARPRDGARSDAKE